MNKLVLGNLVHRPLRSIISALAVAIEVVMILSVVAIFYGMLNGSRTQQSGIGMDMMVRPGAGSAITALGGASAPIGVSDVLRKLPHVQVVAPVNAQLSLGSTLDSVFGIEYQSYNALRPFVFVAGGPFKGPYDMIIDDLQAAKGNPIGSKVVAFNHAFTVCGIVDHGKGSRKFIPLETMDEIQGNPGKAMVFYLRTENQPQFQAEVRREVEDTDGLQGWNVQTLQEYLELLSPERLPGFNIALRVVIGIATIIGFLVIFQSMYTAVMERTREIGILKSMGAGKFTIISVVLRETMLLAFAGIVLGTGSTYLLSAILHKKFPTLAFAVTPDWVLKAVLIALGGAFCGALYPAFKAARKDPIDALSYE